MIDFTAYLLNDEPSQSDEEIMEQLESELAESAPPSLIDEMREKIASAHLAGIKLAREHGSRVLEETVEKEKIALLPLAGLAAGTLGRAVAGGVAKKGIQSAVGGIAKDVAKNVAVDKATTAITRSRQPAQATQVGAGGFKYAQTGGLGAMASKVMGGLGGQAKSLASSVGGKGPGSLGQKIVGGLVRNPHAAMVGAGMVGGAVMAPRDPVTGQKQIMRGALTGGAVGGAATALGAGNKLRSAVVNPKGPQVFGQQAGAFAREATKATGPSAARAAASAVPAGIHTAPASPLSSSVPSTIKAPPVPPAQHARDVADGIAAQQRGVGGWLRGLTGGNVNVPHDIQSPERLKLAAVWQKVANRQTLQYDPTTESFMRRHVTADRSMGPGSDIAAGTVEPVMGHQSTGPRGPAPTGVPPSRGPSQVYSAHGGDVMSSSPAKGIPARPQVTSRPVQAPPPIPSAAMMPKPTGAGGAMLRGPKLPALPSLAGARSLVKRASLRRHLVEGR